jgi:hypothetical protein
MDDGRYRIGIKMSELLRFCPSFNGSAELRKQLKRLAFREYKSTEDPSAVLDRVIDLGQLLEECSKSRGRGAECTDPSDLVEGRVFDEVEKAVRNSDSPLLSLYGPIYDVDDFTFYIRRNGKSACDAVELFLTQEGKRIPKGEVDGEPDGKHRKKNKTRRYSYDCEITIHGFSKTDENKKAEGRALACLCLDGNYWSFTFRKGKGEKTANYHLRQSSTSTGYWASERLKEDTLNTIAQLCNKLYGLIFQSHKSHPTGLVVITGRTGSAKSHIARGLIEKYLTKQIEHLEHLKKPADQTVERRPHLVTFEDPIEACYFEEFIMTDYLPPGPSDEVQMGQQDARTHLNGIPGMTEEKQRKILSATRVSCRNALKSQEYGLDYTPRRKGVDALDLRSVVNDALRQTPTILFVGETRDPEDWKELVRFAGTGHLVFTTSHAGSLTEAMGNIFQATNTESPARRSVIADRILALIHLKPEEICVNEGCECKHRTQCKQQDECEIKKIILPAIWRNTPEAAKALMAEGRASILPRTNENSSSVGRLWFASKLLDSERDTELEKVSRKLKEKAIEWDLEGI